MRNRKSPLRKSCKDRTADHKPFRPTRGLILECLEDRRLLTLASPTTIAVGDFDNDGRDDLAIGKPYETVGYDVKAGLVEVVYGNNGGLSRNDRQTWHQDIPGIRGVAEPNDRFGWALTVGDFNADGYDDLAIGVPFESISGKAAAGVVHVIYGSSKGLTSVNDDLWHQDVRSIEGLLEADDRFGYSLAAGDFNYDGFDDLAIGVAEEDVRRGGVNQIDAGAVNVIYGTTSGLDASGDQIWWQGKGIWGSVEHYDRFGQRLTVGDFNRDGYDDLAIGVPRENLNNIVDAGVVHVIYGASGGLTAAGDQIWHQNIAGIWSGAEKDDYFGSSLAVGDFNRDGFDDLAIGVSEEDITSSGKTVVDAGAVQVIYGQAGGLSAQNDTFHYQGRSIWGSRETGDRFGRSLSVGDYNRDGYDDLAIGVPQENWGALVDSGIVQVLYGSSAGVSTTDQVWHQNISGIWSSNEKYDRYGSALASGDFDNDGYDDLAIEVDGEGFNSDANHGIVNILFGTGSRLTAKGDQVRFSRTYKIDVVFQDSLLSVAQQKTIVRAADRWERVIFGNLPSYRVSGKGRVDDMVVEVSVKNIDGQGGTLATAGSRLLRSSNLPATGVMTIDSADRSNSDLFGIAVHEFGHALGFGGSMIRRHKLFNSNETGFIGANAIREYNSLFGTSATSIPMAADKGHWSESVFDDELMTPIVDTNMKLSRITVGAMEDLGYRVVYSEADQYSPPGNYLKDSLISAGLQFAIPTNSLSHAPTPAPRTWQAFVPTEALMKRNANVRTDLRSLQRIEAGSGLAQDDIEDLKSSGSVFATPAQWNLQANWNKSLRVW